MAATSIILFGATGDLAQQKLLPSLLQLVEDDKEDIRIIALGRREYSREAFIESLLTRFPAQKEEVWQRFSERVFYYKMNILEEGEYKGFHEFLQNLEQEQGGCNRLFYLSVAPDHYPSILHSLANVKLAEEMDDRFRRIVVEKPFGHDQASSIELNKVITSLFCEEQIYRVDHYLAKETVQNILAFRFANGIFEPLWNKDNIDHIQITVSEEEGIKDRGAYYDAAGAFRDIVQNHILQLLTFLTMEEPEDFSFEALSNEKAKILDQLIFKKDWTFFGQYEGYLTEKNIQPTSQTETFAATAFAIDSPRWEGVPIYVRTGKKLCKRISEISLVFKPSKQHLFKSDVKHSNVLTFRIQPDEGISLQLEIKRPKENMKVQPVHMEFCYASAFHTALPDAYQRLFYDILSGEKSLFLREDTIKKSWKVIDEILAQKSEHPLYIYSAGSWGPQEIEDAMEKDGKTWLAHESTICNGIIVDPLN